MPKTIEVAGKICGIVADWHKARIAIPGTCSTGINIGTQYKVAREVTIDPLQVGSCGRTLSAKCGYYRPVNGCTIAAQFSSKVTACL